MRLEEGREASRERKIRDFFFCVYSVVSYRYELLLCHAVCVKYIRMCSLAGHVDVGLRYIALVDKYSYSAGTVSIVDKVLIIYGWEDGQEIREYYDKYFYPYFWFAVVVGVVLPRLLVVLGYDMI